MNCEDYQRRTSALVDGELDHDNAAPVFAHLASCEACRTFFHDLLALNASIDHAVGLPVPPRPAAPGTGPEDRPAAWWQRRVSLRYPSLLAAAVLFCAALLLSFAQLRQAGPVYVTTLAPVVVTAESTLK